MGPAAAAASSPSAPGRPRPGSAARGLPADAREAATGRREGPGQRRPVRPRPLPTRGRSRLPERGPAVRSERGRRSPLRFFFFCLAKESRPKKGAPYCCVIDTAGSLAAFLFAFLEPLVETCARSIIPKCN